MEEARLTEVLTLDQRRDVANAALTVGFVDGDLPVDDDEERVCGFSLADHHLSDRSNAPLGAHEDGAHLGVLAARERRDDALLVLQVTADGSAAVAVDADAKPIIGRGKWHGQHAQLVARRRLREVVAMDDLRHRRERHDLHDALRGAAALAHPERVEGALLVLVARVHAALRLEALRVLERRSVLEHRDLREDHLLTLVDAHALEREGLCSDEGKTLRHRVEPHRLVVGRAQVLHAAQIGGVVEPSIEARVDVCTGAREHGRVLEKLVKPEADEPTHVRAAPGDAVHRVADHLVVGEELAAFVANREQRIDDGGGTIERSTGAAPALHEAPHQIEDALARPSVERILVGDRRQRAPADRHVRSDEQLEVVVVLAEIAAHHEPGVEAERDAVDRPHDGHRLAAGPERRLVGHDVEQLRNERRGDLARVRHREEAAQTLVFVAADPEHEVRSSELLADGAKECLAREVPLCTVEEKVTGLDARDDRELVPPRLDPERRTVLSIELVEQAARVEEKAEALSEHRKSCGARRARKARDRLGANVAHGAH